MFKTFFYSLLFFLIISLSFFSSPALAQTTKTWSGSCINNLGIGYTDVATIQGFECLFYNILQVVVVLAGISFFIMFIVGGFQYLFSSGDPKKAAAASSTLTMAIIGLIGIIVSWFILSFIQKFTGVNVTDFIIPG